MYGNQMLPCSATLYGSFKMQYFAIKEPDAIPNYSDKSFGFLIEIAICLELSLIWY